MFTDALDLEGGRRGSFLNEACRGDDALRAEVDGLLAFAKSAEDFFDRLAGGIGPPEGGLEKPDKPSLG